MQDRPPPYNPLHRVNLGRSVESALLSQPPVPLPPPRSPRFIGAGVYAVYYAGDFPPYQPIAAEDFAIPIYVGKAVPPGARQGKLGLNVDPKSALRDRLMEHYKSLEAAENLDVDDFRCRYLVVEDIWIPLGESLLIAHFKPVWNQVIDGFGIHDPGGGRYQGVRSAWDELHPGRPWYDRLSPHPRGPEELKELIAAHFREHPPRRPEELPAPEEDFLPPDDTD